MNKKSEQTPKNGSQNIRRVNKLSPLDEPEKELKKLKQRESPLGKLFINSPKGQHKVEGCLFGRQTASRNNLLRQIRVGKNKPNRPSSGIRMEHSSTSKPHRPSSTKQKAQLHPENRKKQGNQSSSIDNKRKKKQTIGDQPTDEDSTQFKRLHQKLSYLQGKINAIKSNLDKKNHMKRSETEKMLTVVPKADFKKQRKDPSKKENTDQNALSKFVTQVHSKHSHNVIKKDPYLHTKGAYYVSQIARSFKQDGLPLAKDHIIQCLQTMRFMKDVSKPSAKQIQSKKLNLSRREQYKGKKTIILDLDQTLIHCNQSTSIPHDVELQIKFPTEQRIDAGINIRPFAAELLKILSQRFEVIIFTASHPCYANVVIDYLDPESKMVSHRLYRDNCWHTEQGVYVKDLRVLGNRNLSEVVLVDNAAYSYYFQIENGIPIIPYYQGKNDYQLKHLLQYLNQIENAKDVRDVNRKHFKLQKYLSYTDPEQLATQLYSQWLQK